MSLALAPGKRNNPAGDREGSSVQVVLRGASLAFRGHGTFTGNFRGRGRDRGFPRPPAQIRVGRITGLGSYLEYERRTDPKVQGQVTFAEEAAISSWLMVNLELSREEDLSTRMNSRGVLGGIHSATL